MLRRVFSLTIEKKLKITIIIIHSVVGFVKVPNEIRLKKSKTLSSTLAFMNSMYELAIFGFCFQSQCPSANRK